MTDLLHEYDLEKLGADFARLSEQMWEVITTSQQLLDDDNHTLPQFKKDRLRITLARLTYEVSRAVAILSDRTPQHEEVPKWADLFGIDPDYGEEEDNEHAGGDSPSPDG